MSNTTRIFIAFAILWGLISCSFTKTIYVPHGKAVRLRETVKRVKVWVKDAEGKSIAGKINLPEGWYCLPDPGEKKNGERSTDKQLSVITH